MLAHGVSMSGKTLNDMLGDFVKQIFPVRVQGVDQINFLLARTTLDLLFSRNGGVDIISYFVIDELMDVVPFRKSAADAILVFINPTR
jgi:hypothetical protein